MATREITGALRRLDGTAWPGAEIKFRLLTDYAVASTATMTQTVTEVTTGVDGSFSVNLEVPDSGGWRYNCVLPDGQGFEFIFGAGATTTLRAIILDLSTDVTEELEGSIASLIAGKIDAIASPTAGDFVTQTAGGNIQGAGVSIASFIQTIGGATDGNAVSQTGAGAIQDAGFAVTDIFRISQNFASSAQAAALAEMEAALSPGLFGVSLKGVEGDLIHVSLNGAVGDDATEDTTAIQAILDTYEGTTTHVTIQFAEGKTYLTDTLTWAGTGRLRLRGGTLRLANAGQQMLNITGAQRVEFEDMTFKGNATNQTDAATALVYVGTNGDSTELVSVRRCRFEDARNLGLQIFNETVGGTGSELVWLQDLEFVDCLQGAAGGQPISVFIRGNHQRVYSNNISFYNCATVDAGKCLAYSSDIASEQIGLAVATNIRAEYSGTAFFGQSINQLLVSGIQIEECGTDTLGNDYNVNFLKLDDVGPDSLVTIANVTGRTNNTDHDPAFRIEESTGSGQFVTTKVRLINIDIEGDIVASGTGDHDLLMCTAREDLTIGGSAGGDTILMSEAGNTFNVQAANALVKGCTSPAMAITSSGGGTLVDGCHITGGILDVQSGAENVTVENCNLSGTAWIRLSGSKQYARNNTIITTSDQAIRVNTAGATEIVIEHNTLSSAESFSTTPVIAMNDPAQVTIRDNTILATSGRGSIGRTSFSLSNNIYGEITGNRGVRTHRQLNVTLGELRLEDNGYWNAGVWTPLLPDLNAFTDLDTTPSVLSHSEFEFAYSVATTVTYFDDGYDGKQIYIRSSTANTTLEHSAAGPGIFLASQGDVLLPSGASLLLRYDAADDLWYEIGPAGFLPLAGGTLTGSLIAVASAADAVPISVTMHASQTAAGFSVNDSSDVPQFQVDASGYIKVLERSNHPNTGVIGFEIIDSDDQVRLEIGTNYIGFNYTNDNQFFSVTQDANLATVVKLDRPSLDGYGGFIRGGQNTFGSNRGIAMYPEDDNIRVGILGTALAQVGLVFNADGTGLMDATFGPTVDAEAAQVAILNDTPSDAVLILRAATSQSGHALAIQNPAGTNQLYVDSSYIINFDMTMAAGTEDPTTDAPDGWLEISVGGATKHVPYYD